MKRIPAYVFEIVFFDGWSVRQTRLLLYALLWLKYGQNHGLSCAMCSFPRMLVLWQLFALRGPQPSCIRHACWLLIGLCIGSGMVLGRMWCGFGVIEACLEQGSMAIGWAVAMCVVQAFICAHKVRTFYFGSSVRIFLDYWFLFFTESCFYGNRL